jgi:hypothetical protein
MLIITEPYVRLYYVNLLCYIVFTYLLQFYLVNFYLLMCWTSSLGLYYRLLQVQPNVQANMVIKSES